MKLMELIGEPVELTPRSSYPPTNLDILKHITFKRRQFRKSVYPGSHLFLSISEELMSMCPGDISPYPKLYIFLKIDRLEKKLQNIKKLPDIGRPAALRFIEELSKPFTVGRTGQTAARSGHSAKRTKR
ncbi:uncharacterized protein LOC134818968 [Bolinopsis microptera]|uniref:uncharacterized protein LOC134818968 n=1 Tax=Bolinopsis microptera TaxID=2820187 RepID=UPI00307A7607